MTRIIAGCSSNTCMNNDSLKLTLRYLPKVQKQKKARNNINIYPLQFAAIRLQTTTNLFP